MIMIAPNAEAGSSVNNKTGDWRTYRPEVNKPKCIKCGQCALYCPEGCIEIKEDGSKVDYDFCKGCGICAQVCPVKCIEMKAEEK